MFNSVEHMVDLDHVENYEIMVIDVV